MPIASIDTTRCFGLRCHKTGKDLYWEIEENPEILFKNTCVAMIIAAEEPEEAALATNPALATAWAEYVATLPEETDEPLAAIVSRFPAEGHTVLEIVTEGETEDEPDVRYYWIENTPNGRFAFLMAAPE